MYTKSISLLFIFILIFSLQLFSKKNNSKVSTNISDTTKISQLSGASDTLDSIDNSSKDFIPDTVYLKNGDQITGKILSFQQGRLKIDGQGPGVISIKWNKISSIDGGNRVFKIEDINGSIYIAEINFSPDTGEIQLRNKLRYGIKLENVVRIFPLEDDWYRGIKGSLGVGLNYAKSSDVLTVNAEYNLYYVISKWRFINDFSFISTSVGHEDASIRTQINFQALYALPKRWVLSEINSFSRNDELGVKSRFSFGIGGGNNIVQSEWQRLLILTGIMENFEENIETNKVGSNAEWPITLQHNIYKFFRPNLSLSTSITSFVGITEKDRYRFEASTDITWEFITDFKFKFSYYYNFDNKTIEGKNTTKDYGTILSLVLDLR